MGYPKHHTEHVINARRGMTGVDKKFAFWQRRRGAIANIFNLVKMGHYKEANRLMRSLNEVEQKDLMGRLSYDEKVRLVDAA